MSFNSLKFIIFVFPAVAGYYAIPRRYQWMWLLGFSYLYYASYGWYFLGYLLFTTLTTYAAARWIDSCDQAKVKRRILVLGLVLNFGMLGFLKYLNFAILNINRLVHGNLGFLDIALPIGVSFYIFQSMGYLLDVYWKRVEAETNPFRFALFVSFFPQILQGPIGRYSRLAGQLYASHDWDGKNVEIGLWRILWGFFKKIVVADTAAVFVTALFDEYQTYPGLAIFAVLAYSAQLYGDFSGGVDIVIGIAKMFGITMDENFRQPFFAVSITDFWHRWHITLGTWMKDYVFYPVSLSRWMNRFGKWARKKFGRKTGRTLPICIANLIVFFVVGVWHGAEWKYIVYGLYNGGIIAISGLLADSYRKWKKCLHINDKAFSWRLFQILRTFLLVNISWFFDCADSVSQAFVMMKNSVTYWTPAQLLTIPVGAGQTTSYTLAALLILLLGVCVIFVYSIFEERGICIAEKVQQLPVFCRILVYGIMFMLLPVLGQLPTLTGGFIYAQF